MGFSRQEYWSGFAISFSRGSSQPRDWIQLSHIAGRLFTVWATKESQFNPKRGIIPLLPFFSLVSFFSLTFSSISYFIIWNNALAPLFLFNLFLLDLCLDPKKCPVCQMKKKKSLLYLSLMLINALRYSLLSLFPFHCQTSWNSSLYSCLHLPHFSFLNILQPGLCTHWLYWNSFQEPTISVLSKIKAFSF